LKEKKITRTQKIQKIIRGSLVIMKATGNGRKNIITNMVMFPIIMESHNVN
jgi:hypothetical protein